MRKLMNWITCNHPKRLIKPSIWNALASLANLFPFLCLAHIVGEIYEFYVTGERNMKGLWAAWGIMLVFFVVTYILENIACKYTYRDGFMASADGRVKLAEHIRKLPLGFLMGKESGEIGNTMMNDFSKTETAMTHIMPQILSGILIAIIAPVFMLILDWRMGLAALVGLPAALFIMLGMQRLEHRLAGRLSKAKAEQAEKMEEYLYGMQIIKAYNMQGQGFGKLKEACQNYRDASIKVESGIGPLNLTAAAFLRSGLSFMTIVGTYLVLGGHLDVPSFALFLLVGTRIFDPLAVAVMNYSELMMCGMAGERIVKLLEEPVMGGDKDVLENHEICFDNVSFGYGKEGVLHHVSAVMKAGTLTALVGPSGSGKSTMLRLIARFYDPDEGRVTFGGQNEKETDPEKLMKKISMVFQDVYLFRDTVANNIRYGKEDATQAEIEAAAKMANCYDFITQMPEGFQTMIGEGGSTLSGGEKQRISIARAVLKDAPVILLDEATASLDPENEAEIQQAVSRLIKDRTVVVIAHRLATIVGADNILVMDKGRIVEKGTHETLLNRKGLYAKLWNLQTATQGWGI